ncbi:MAG: DUF885 family protein [Cyclobacteriaceae bacterium]
MIRNLFYLVLLSGLAVGCTKTDEPVAKATTYEELVQLFEEWRQFHAPKMIDGVPDYSAAAMSQQHAELARWQQRLNNFDTANWPIKHQIDWYLVWAEMNGLDFEHRVLKPWSRDPAFYVWFYPDPSDVPEREAPNMHGAIELPNYAMPLSQKDADELADRLQKASAVYEQARINLTGDAKDLWVLGIRSIRSQSQELRAFAEAQSPAYPKLAGAAEEAAKASDAFAGWLEEQAPNKNGISGVGKENYSWNLKNVHLMPYTWEEQVLLMERELARSHSGLRMAEHKNRDLPKLSKIQTEEEFNQRINAGVDEFMEFLEVDEIMTVKDYMEPAMRAQVGKFFPSEGIRGFFYEIDYRDPMPMRCHHFHWIELARNREEPNASPIRRRPLLSNIFDGRAEGMATAMEELMMNAGLYKDRPRGTELVYIMLAQRAARGLGGLYQHGQEMSHQQACDYASKWVPWGLLPADGGTIQGEEHFYLRQPGYGTSYVMGKLDIDMLIAEYARQREGNFELREFMDKFNRVGVIPVSLVYWEMTGDKSMLNRALQQ